MSELNWWVIFSKHWGKILGGLLGLIFAILVVSYGFWVSVFIFLCIAVGILIGWRLDVGPGISRYLNRFFSPKEKE